MSQSRSCACPHTPASLSYNYSKEELTLNRDSLLVTMIIKWKKYQACLLDEKNIWNWNWKCSIYHDKLETIISQIDDMSLQAWNIYYGFKFTFSSTIYASGILKTQIFCTLSNIGLSKNIKIRWLFVILFDLL